MSDSGTVETVKKHFTRSRTSSDNISMPTNDQSVKNTNKNRKNHGVIEIKDGSCQTDLVQDTMLNEELKLLQLENCTLRNKYDDVVHEANLLKQKNEEYSKKLELMNKQLECVNEIMESNEKLKKESNLLREKYEAVNLEKYEELQIKVVNLEEKLKDTDEILHKNGLLQTKVEKLSNDLKVAELTVEGLKEIMSKLSDAESIDDEVSATENPKRQLTPQSSDDNHANNKEKYNTGKRFDPYKRVQSNIRFGTNSKTWDNEKSFDSNIRGKFNNRRRFQRSQTFYNRKLNH